MRRYPEGRWAPVVILTLIHIHVYPQPLPQSESSEMALATLEAGKLIERKLPAVAHPTGWDLTERGRAHLRMLCQMPYPCATEGEVSETWYTEVSAHVTIRGGD